MSLIPTLLAIAAGLIAGHALTSLQLWRARHALHAARHAATHDDLTGLPNRRALLAHLAAARRRGEPVTLAMLDLDRFKAVNDTLGHDAGDELLTEIAARIAARPAPVRLAARLQGDEFILVIDGASGTGMTAARAAWRAISGTGVLLADTYVTVTASVGVTASRPGVTDSHLLHEADLAMYEAKRTGGGVLAYRATADAQVRPRPARRHRDRPYHDDQPDDRHRDSGRPGS